VLEGHGDSVRSVTWDSRGNQLASGSSDGTVRVWAVPEGKLLKTLIVGSPVFAVSWSPEVCVTVRAILLECVFAATSMAAVAAHCLCFPLGHEGSTVCSVRFG